MNFSEVELKRRATLLPRITMKNSRSRTEAKGHPPSEKNHEKFNANKCLLNIACISFSFYGILLFSALMITDISMVVEESNLEITNQQPIYHHVQVTKNATRIIEPAVQMQEQSSLRGRRDVNHTGTFYSLLKSKQCLPSSSCSSCLNMGKTCQQCGSCGCFCKHLCKVSNENIQQVFDYHLIPDRNPAQRHHMPKQQEGGQRLIPKIVHQTWKENITQELYPKKKYISILMETKRLGISILQ